VPIPEFNTHGCLPGGLHDCTLDELRSRFGVFQESDRRPRLFAQLEALVQACASAGLFEALIVDGSFVTAKPTPNDIDLIAVLRPGHDFERDLPMSEYALVSRALLRRRFGFDVVVVERDSALQATYLEFFSLVRERPGLKKGLLRLRL
jgi:hypothetical protein